jgi:hypothetical protein
MPAQASASGMQDATPSTAQQICFAAQSASLVHEKLSLQLRAAVSQLRIIAEGRPSAAETVHTQQYSSGLAPQATDPHASERTGGSTAGAGRAAA